MEMNFCQRCGEQLYKGPDVSFYECNSGHYTFPSPRPTASVFFVDGDNVVVSRRGIEPRKGTLDSIGGFVDTDETIEVALVREISEETNLTPEDYSTPIYFGSATSTYLYQEQEIPVIGSMYWSRLKTEKEITAKDDVASIEKISLAEVDVSQFGMADVQTGILKLQTLWKDGGLNG